MTSHQKGMVKKKKMSDEEAYKIYNWNEVNYDWKDRGNDPVTHPSHYTSGKIEVIDFITDQKLDFCLGNVIKYVSRAGKKSENGKDIKTKTIEDLEKAKFYLNYKIKILKDDEQDDSDRMS